MPKPVPVSPICPCGYSLAGLPGPPWTCPECARVTELLPTCPCGYILAGLPGPPWRCPECSEHTEYWPPHPGAVVVTRAEHRALALWLIGVCAGSAALPWITGLNENRLIWIGLYISAGLGALVWSSLFSREARSRGLSIWLLHRVFWAMCVLFVSVAIAFFIAFLSETLRYLLTHRS